jgi:hypothetical protein
MHFSESRFEAKPSKGLEPLDKGAELVVQQLGKKFVLHCSASCKFLFIFLKIKICMLSSKVFEGSKFAGRFSAPIWHSLPHPYQSEYNMVHMCVV